MKKKLLLIGFLVYQTTVLFAQSTGSATGGDFYDLSLEELMNMKISVASVKALTARESPGIITLITEDEVRGSGARDIMDLLNNIPGFDFGVDVQGVIGLGVRGNWAHEGKFLLLIDGQEMNENLFSSVQFGNHYPIDNIKQIEIIRGPGSAMYGGFAEYAVINVITKNGEDINGVSVDGNLCSTSKGLSGSRSALTLGKKIKDFSFCINTNAGYIKRSDQLYTDIDGTSFDMNSNSGIKNFFTNASIAYKKFQLRLITDNYHIQTRDNYTQASSRPYLQTFDSYFIELKKELTITKKISLYPKISYKKQIPWNYTDQSYMDEMAQFSIQSEKSNASLYANYDPSEKVSLSAGMDGSYLVATNLITNSYFNDGSPKMHYYNMAGFIQTLLRLGIADFTLGARYNFNSLYNPSFVPRIGITRVFKKFHLKCLYSQAFRAPNTENIDLGVNIQPEKTAVTEIEAGVQLSEKMFITLNAYHISTSNTIVYYYDSYTESDVYKNYYRSGTQGIELVYKLKNKLGWLEFNYSFYSSKNNSRLENYSVPGHNDVLLGFPAHKINARGNFKIWKNLKLIPGITYRSSKFDYRGSTADNKKLIYRYPSTCIADLCFNYDNLFFSGLHAGIGIYNLFNVNQFYIQPYNSMHAPIPGQSREYSVKLTYEFKFKK